MTLQLCSAPPSIDAADLHDIRFAGEYAAAQSRQCQLAVAKGVQGIDIIGEVVFAKSPVEALDERSRAGGQGTEQRNGLRERDQR